MLKHLSIKNYAIIHELEVDFHSNLNIITGETGAGKSILVGALNMILGKRADLSVLRDNSKKCIIEGTFTINKEQFEYFFNEHDLDFELNTTIRRELRPDGKSRAFINDTPVKLNQLKELTEQLVDLHSQDETQALLDPQFYINILDNLAKQTSEVNKFAQDFTAFSKEKKRLKTLESDLIKLKANQDYLQFQFDELDTLNLTKEDGEALEEELSLLENAEEIQASIASCLQIIDGDEEVNLLALFADFSNKINSISKFGKEFEQLNERLESISIEINDINHELNAFANDITFDEERLAELSERQNDINRLIQKHQVQTVDDLIELKLSLQKQLEDVSFGEEDLSNLKAKLDAEQKLLFKRAQVISKNRISQTNTFKKQIEKILTQIGMPHATIQMEHTLFTTENINAFGIDQFDLLFSANKGSLPQTLKKVASGGERSRLMLAIKSTIAENITLPTLIFDEIDTGISGEVAYKVGRIFKALATNHQLISITHLPQIAAKADHHLFVYKDHSDDKTTTNIKVLNKKEQIVEIATMLSGENPGDAALKTAKELIN